MLLLSPCLPPFPAKLPFAGILPPTPPPFFPLPFPSTTLCPLFRPIHLAYHPYFTPTRYTLPGFQQSEEFSASVGAVGACLSSLHSVPSATVFKKEESQDESWELPSCMSGPETFGRKLTQCFLWPKLVGCSPFSQPHPQHPCPTNPLILSAWLFLV